MTQTYFPFDSGQGGSVTETQWQKMAQHWLSTGVIKTMLNELRVYADSTGLQVKVKSGQAWIKGHFFESDTEEILPISTANATIPRIDRVIVRVDWTANTIQLAVLQGTPAASPTAPALTQILGSRWEISLAQISVGANVSTITAGNVTDERTTVANFTLSTNGQLNVPTQSYVHANNNGTISIPSGGVNTKISSYITVYDNQSEFSNGKFTAKENGKYLVRLYTDINTSPAGLLFSHKLYKNGASWASMGSFLSDQKYLASMILVDLVAGDTIELYASQTDATTARNIVSLILQIAKIQ